MKAKGLKLRRDNPDGSFQDANAARVQSGRGGGLVLMLAVAVLLFCFVLWLGHKQFGGFDLGTIIEGAYRMHLGERPYVDFITSQPYLSLAGAALAFHCLGVSWSSLVVLAAISASLGYLLQSFLLTKAGVPWKWATSTAFACQCGVWVTGDYWWYNFMTAAGLLLLLSALAAGLRHPENKAIWLIYATVAGLVALTKPNTAGPALVVFTLILIVYRPVRAYGMVATLLGGIFSLSLLEVLRLSPLIVLRSYCAGAGRGVPLWSRFVQDQPPIVVGLSLITIGVCLIPLFVWLWARCFRQIVTPNHGRGMALRLACLASVLCSLYGMFTNGELKTVEVPLILLAGVLLYFADLGQPVGEQSLMQRCRDYGFICGAISSFILISGLFGVTRFRVEAIGSGAFYQRGPLRQIGVQNVFFKHLYAGAIQHAIVGQIQKVIDDFENKNGRPPVTFFGPRMNWGYAAFNLKPPAGFPLSWFVNVEFAAYELDEIVSRFTRSEFDLIFLFGGGDVTYMDSRLITHLQSRYSLISRTDVLTVLGGKK